MARGGSSQDSRHGICYLLAQLTEEERFCSGRRGDRSPTYTEAEGEGDSIGKTLKGRLVGSSCGQTLTPTTAKYMIPPRIATPRYPSRILPSSV